MLSGPESAVICKDGGVNSVNDTLRRRLLYDADNRENASTEAERGRLPGNASKSAFIKVRLDLSTSV